MIEKLIEVILDPCLHLNTRSIIKSIMSDSSKSISSSESLKKLIKIFFSFGVIIEHIGIVRHFVVSKQEIDRAFPVDVVTFNQ